MFKLLKVEKLSVGTTAKSVMVSGHAFLIANNSSEASVYFKEKAIDGTAATSSNGFLLPAGKTTDEPIVAEELSVVASAASTDVRVLILDCYA